MLVHAGRIRNKFYSEIEGIIGAYYFHSKIWRIIHNLPFSTLRWCVRNGFNLQIGKTRANPHSEIPTILHYLNSAFQHLALALAIFRNFIRFRSTWRISTICPSRFFRSPIVPTNNGNVVLAVMTEQTSVLTPFGNSAMFRLYHLFLAFVLCENHTRQNYKYQQ